MKVGMIGGAMKPVTKGHWALIKRASKENDRVLLFISTSDRGNSNEALITGSDMREIWESHLMLHLPPNVNVEFGGSPIKKIYETLGEANENHSIDTFRVYSDPVDIEARFPEDKQQKYFGELYKHDQVEFVAVERSGDMDVSGSQMRSLLKNGMKAEFISLLPEGVDGEGIWKILVVKSFIRQV